MGLSVMENAPGFEQQMVLANQANRMGYIQPDQWVGEQNLNGLGMGETQTDISQGINTVTNAGLQIYNSIQQAKIAKEAAKHGKSLGKPAAKSPAPMNMTAHGDGGGNADLTKYLIYGGIAIVGVLILTKVMKKKPRDRDRDRHDRDDDHDHGDN